MYEHQIPPQFRTHREHGNIKGWVNVYNPPIKTDFQSNRSLSMAYYLAIIETVETRPNNESDWGQYTELIMIKPTAKVGNPTYQRDLVTDFSTAVLEAVELLDIKVGLIQ